MGMFNHPIFRKVSTICLCLSVVLLSLLFFSPSSSTADSLNVEVKDFACKEGRFFISLSLRNNYTYNRHLLVALKILKGEQAAACKMTEMTVAGNSEETKEISLDQACEGEDYYLKYRVFDRRDRARANNWLSDCPGS